MAKGSLAGWFAVLALTGVAVAGCSAKTVDTKTYDAPWKLVSSSPTGSSVVVEYAHGNCDKLAGTPVTRNNDSVRISVQIKYTAESCDAAAVFTQLRVPLGEALGSRQIDGACSPSDSGLAGVLCNTKR